MNGSIANREASHEADSVSSASRVATSGSLPGHERRPRAAPRPVDAAEYEAVRELWKQHSKAEDRRDLPGLLSTLTEDCVYEIVGTEHVWHGHEGASRFYAGCSARSRTSTSS